MVILVHEFQADLTKLAYCCQLISCMHTCCYMQLINTPLITPKQPFCELFQPQRITGVMHQTMAQLDEKNVGEMILVR